MTNTAIISCWSTYAWFIICPGWRCQQGSMAGSMASTPIQWPMPSKQWVQNHSWYLVSTRTSQPPAVKLLTCPLQGMDVSHPPPGVKNMPSIAGVVASMNHLSTKYEAQSRVQDPTVEIIADLGVMVKVSDFRLSKFTPCSTKAEPHGQLCGCKQSTPLTIDILQRRGLGRSIFRGLPTGIGGDWSYASDHSPSVPFNPFFTEVIHSYQADYMKQKSGKPKITFVVVRKRYLVPLWMDVFVAHATLDTTYGFFRLMERCVLCNFDVTPILNYL